MKISTAEKGKKRKIRAEGTALERNLKSLMFYIHFTWAEIKYSRSWEWRRDLLDRIVDYVSPL